MSVNFVLMVTQKCSSMSWIDPLETPNNSTGFRRNRGHSPYMGYRYGGNDYLSVQGCYLLPVGPKFKYPNGTVSTTLISVPGSIADLSVHGCSLVRRARPKMTPPITPKRVARVNPLLRRHPVNWAKSNKIWTTRSNWSLNIAKFVKFGKPNIL